MGAGIPTRWWQVGILLEVAFRNLFASRLKTLIVGGIILFGAVLVVVGSSLVDTIDRGMRASIQGSLAGHVQVYSARSKEDLALYGGMMGESDLEPIEDFGKLRRVLLSVPNVAALVPMGIDQAMVATGNQFDVALEKLRADVRRIGTAPAALARDPEYRAHEAHVHRMVSLLREQLEASRTLVEETPERVREWADLGRAADPAFWDALEADVLGGLEFLENRIAPLALENAFTYVRYVGTDPEAFQRAFPRMRVVEGTAIPKGERGILIGRLYAEDWLKLKTARRLDKIREAIQMHHRRIERDEELKRWVKENTGQTSEILLQLDPIRAAEATRRLQRALGTDEPDLHKLLVRLVDVDDGSFEPHYRIFYSELAPLLQLYTVRVGDTVTVKAPSKTGYMNSVNVKVHGIIEFRGLEKSAFAGMMSVMDILSFRDLYGFLTPEKAEEIRRLKETAGLRSVSRENAEAELFGGGAALVAEGKTARIDEAALGRRTEERAQARPYTQEDVDRGVALNVAVILKDPRRIPQAIRDIQAAAAKEGLAVKAVSWQQATGFVGQFVSLARLILYIAVLIIFAVALVIINNAMVMATLQRVKEIGTMRAIGAQRRFVLVMVVVETVAVGLAFGALGAGLGAGIVWLVRARGGIPAMNDTVYFFFSGPSLVPSLGAGSLAVSLAIVFAVSMASAIYPALLAMRITPVEAMQSDE